MPLDITLFRTNPDLIRESQRKRFAKVEVVDQVLALDQKWKETKHKLDTTRANLNATSKKIGQLYRTKGDGAAEARKQATELRNAIPKVKQEIAELTKQVVEFESQRDKLINTIGNIVYEKIPSTHDESENEVVRKWGSFKKPNVKTLRAHYDLLHMIGGYDAERGVKVMGHRGYFLTGIGAKLNLALVSYATDFLRDRDYTTLTTPFFMKKDQMAKTAQLEDFDEQLYKVSTSSKNPSDDKYLIATSEQPISCFHEGEWIQPSQLPLRYAGVSTCFRKEAGSSGRDLRGIFRVHQFDKVEQFCLTAPDKSWEMHEIMTNNAEEFLKSLGIPYRVVKICSGELNNAAAKKYDIECWFPEFCDFRELVSSSNCTDYQSRALEVRFGTKKKGEKQYVHMLNSTLCATTRAISVILENYQTDDGIIVPPVLRKYLGTPFIEFVNKPPVHVQQKKKQPNKKNNNNKKNQKK